MLKKELQDTQEQLRCVLAWGSARENPKDVDVANDSVQELIASRDAFAKQLEEQTIAMSHMKAEKTAAADKMVDDYKAKLEAEESKRRELQLDHDANMRKMEKEFQQKLQKVKEEQDFFP